MNIRVVLHRVKGYKMRNLTSRFLKFLETLHIHPPFLTEQHRNVTMINESMVLSVRMETTLKESDTTRLDLFNALLRGELDPMAQSLESVK